MKSRGCNIKRKPKRESVLSAKDLEGIPLGDTLLIMVEDFHQLKCYRQLVYYVSGTSNKRYETTEKPLHNNTNKVLFIKRTA